MGLLRVGKRLLCAVCHTRRVVRDSVGYVAAKKKVTEVVQVESGCIRDILIYK